jgi:catechol 2,3-dioxygenase-like lactoylglutathione lyase family enzyme
MLTRIIAATLLLTTATAANAQVQRIDAISYVVSDARASAGFYERALSFRRVGEVESRDPALAKLRSLPNARTRTVTMRLGNQTVELVQYLDTPGRPIPADSRSEDRWFQHFAIIVSDMKRAYAQLSAAKPVPITQGGPQTLPANTGGVTAFKFHDPDGHPLELLALPPGVGRPLWHEASNATFLGIDHSAIGIGSTPESVSFYRDLLGFTVAGGTVNQGKGQTNLDGAPDATVAITPLRPPADESAGIELLDYLAPGDGRSAPTDGRANDLWYVELRMTVNDLPALAARLKAAGATFVSPGIVEVQGQDFTKALLVRDPDGHALLLTQ